MTANNPSKYYPLSGGQFEPVSTGQFEPAKGGQFQPVGGGQLKPDFALIPKNPQHVHVGDFWFYTLRILKTGGCKTHLEGDRA